MRLGYPEIALLATVGLNQVQVHRRPVVAIIATGDEIVEAGVMPASWIVTYQGGNATKAYVGPDAAGIIPGTFLHLTDRLDNVPERYRPQPKQPS